MTDELNEYSTHLKTLIFFFKPSAYFVKNFLDETRKWKKADSPRNKATVKLTLLLNKSTGLLKVDPGGPVMYVAVTGRVKSFDSNSTPINDIRCKKPAAMFHVLSEFICLTIVLFMARL